MENLNRGFLEPSDYNLQFLLKKPTKNTVTALLINICMLTATAAIVTVI